MLGFLLIIVLVYIIYITHRWNERMDKKLEELERNIFQSERNNFQDMNKVLNLQLDEISEIKRTSKSPTLDKYLQEIERSELLTKEEEVELAQKIKEGDKIALEKLTQANLRFVVPISEKYENKGLSLPDLINEGNLGLIKAAKVYTGKVRFVKFANKFIRNNIRREIQVNSGKYSQPYQEEQPIVPRHRICLTCASRSIGEE